MRPTGSNSCLLPVLPSENQQTQETLARQHEGRQRLRELWSRGAAAGTIFIFSNFNLSGATGRSEVRGERDVAVWKAASKACWERMRRAEREQGGVIGRVAQC